MDRIEPSGQNWIEVNLIGPNINCLIFRENKLSLKNFKEKKYTSYYNIK